MRSINAQADAVRQVAGWYRDRKGPKPGTPESAFLASLLDDAEKSLRWLNDHRDIMLEMAKQGRAFP